MDDRQGEAGALGLRAVTASAKGRLRDALGDEQATLHIASDSAAPVVLRLAALRRATAAMDAGAVLRQAVLEGDEAPDLAFLHAALPANCVISSAPPALLALAALADPAPALAEILGGAVLALPAATGPALAEAALAALAAHPHAEGLLLAGRGHVTWADNAEAAHRRLHAHLAQAEAWLAAHRPTATAIAEAPPPPTPAAGAEAMLALRKHWAAPVLACRHSAPIAAFLARPDLATLAAAAPGVALAEGAPAAGVRILWAPGIGVIGIGEDAGAAGRNADLGVEMLAVIRDAEAAGGWGGLALPEIPAVPARAFTGRIALVTGGAGAIGLATAQAFAAEGAAIFLVDRDAAALAGALDRLGPGHAGLACDITRPGAPAEAVAACAARFGGLDILISNAGAAMQGDIATLPDATLRASFELNFFAHLAFAQAAIAAFRDQDRPGQMLFNVSKQAVNPGKGFGAYGIPKAATFFLLRQLALELGPEGVRVNGINADRIRSGLLTPEMIAGRARARGLSEADYLGGNLLRREVEARHVAEAFVALARSERTTGHVMTVDGGNIEAALR